MMELKPGEVICDKCNGSGLNKDPMFQDIWGLTDCPKCDGKGKLDWIANIVGKQQPAYFSFDIEKQILEPKDRCLNGDWTIEIVDKVSKSLAETIDKDIINSYLGTCKNE